MRIKWATQRGLANRSSRFASANLVITKIAARAVFIAGVVATTSQVACASGKLEHFTPVQLPSFNGAPYQDVRDVNDHGLVLVQAADERIDWPYIGTVRTGQYALYDGLTFRALPHTYGGGSLHWLRLLNDGTAYGVVWIPRTQTQSGSAQLVRIREGGTVEALQSSLVDTVSFPKVEAYEPDRAVISWDPTYSTDKSAMYEGSVEIMQGSYELDSADPQHWPFVRRTPSEYYAVMRTRNVGSPDSSWTLKDPHGVISGPYVSQFPKYPYDVWAGYDSVYEARAKLRDNRVEDTSEPWYYGLKQNSVTQMGLVVNCWDATVATYGLHDGFWQQLGNIGVFPSTIGTMPLFGYYSTFTGNSVYGILARPKVYDWQWDPETFSPINSRGQFGNGNLLYSPTDTDEDGIPDDWEAAQGIDIDWDGTNDVALVGADPNKIDIFVEYDIMAGQDTPSLHEAFRYVEDSFQKKGINLHFVDGEDVLPSYPIIDEDTLSVKQFIDVSFENFFGTPTENLHPFAKECKMAKATVCRYLVICDAALTSSNGGKKKNRLNGVARGIPSNSFAVFAQSGSRQPEELAYTIMHELGHTIGLGHGGADHIIGKPNYVSVMNYIYKPLIKPDGWMAVPNWSLDFSSEKLDLDERALMEYPGKSLKSTMPGTVMPFGTGLPRRIQWATLDGKGIDWSGDFVFQEAALTAEDPNFWGANTAVAGTNLPSPSQPLPGYDDWAHIRESRFLSPFVAALERGSLNGNEADAALDCPTVEADEEMIDRYPVLPSIRLSVATPGGNMPARTVEVEVMPTAGGPSETRACTVTANGRLTTPLPATPGSYQLTLHDKGALTKRLNVLVGNGVMLYVNSALAYGDIDGDNTVSLFDYLILSEYFERERTQPGWDKPGANGFRPQDADIDRDGVVSLFDYLFLSENFDKIGD